ncbi:mediator of RNA polymerase II transcription subunit 1.1-like isoform X2 [Betta splendens]|uniref:Mediator of RNA polymerase II transcription subunit 1.1-like isoform X2 n=1 Tax=Betta splendens TaxID=158456 RepID=A0A6P7LZ08_BETSP|nr:mediator of RNA polymerase II transcription subunit 1.1-like isoform X2 [Betta splendens]
MDAFSPVSSPPPRPRSLDSGVDVLVEINSDDFQPSSEEEETRDDKQNLSRHRSSPELKGNVSNELSDPDATEELKVCPSSVTPEADAGSTLDVPPPLPPKFYKKTRTCEETTNQGTALKALTEEEESLNSYQRPSLAGRVKGFNQSSDGEIPEHDTLGTVPEPQSEPSLPAKPPKKPPRIHIPGRQKTCKQDAVKGESEKRSPVLPKPKPRKQNPVRREEEVKVTDRPKQQDQLDTRTTGLDVEGPEGAAELEMTPQQEEMLSEAAQDEADGRSSPGPGPVHGTEEPSVDAQEPGETEVERRQKQTQKARLRLKQLAKNIASKFKEMREERRRNKAEGADPAAVTQEETEAREGGGGKEEEEERKDAITEMPTITSRFKNRQEASESPFGSFKVYSHTALYGDLLSDDAWSRLLSLEQSSPESSEPPTRLSGSLPSGAAPEVVLGAQMCPDVPSVDSVAPEEGSLYEDVEISGFNPKETSSAASSHSPEENSDPSLETNSIYETVELKQPLQCKDYFTTVKPHVRLDSSIQKYLIKLNKKRKHKRKRHRTKWHHRTNAVSSNTSLQIFSSSVFYRVATAGGDEEQVHTEPSAGQ